MVVKAPKNISQDEINKIKQSIPKKYTGQSRAVNYRLINHRRNMVHSLLSKGLTTYQVANLIGCSQPLVVSDAAYLRKYY